MEGMIEKNNLLIAIKKFKKIETIFESKKKISIQMNQ